MKDTNSMNIQFQARNLNCNASLRHWLKQPLRRLQSLVPITAAEVVEHVILRRSGW